MAGYDGYGMPAVDFSALGDLPQIHQRAKQQRSLSELAESLAGSNPDWKAAAAKAFQGGNPVLGMQLLQRGSALEQAETVKQSLHEVFGGAPADRPLPPPSTARPLPGTIPAPEREPPVDGFRPRTSYNQNEKIVSAVPQGEGANEGVNIAADFAQRFAAAGPAIPPPQPLPPPPQQRVAQAPIGTEFSAKAARLITALAHPDLDPNTRQSIMTVLPSLLPKDNKIMTTPDGTILAVNERTGQVTSLYQTPEKPAFTDLGTDPNTGEPVKGFVDPRARKVEPYNLPGSGDGPINPFAPGGKVTEGQSKDGGYATRMLNAEKVLRDPSVESAATNLKQNVYGAAPSFAANYLTSPEYQKFDQAKRNFVNAVLRRESGAAISQSEFVNAEKQYFPQPGDTPEKIAEKRRNRQDAIAGVGSGAGPRYRPPYTFGADGELVPSVKPPPGTAAPTPKTVKPAPAAPVEGARKAPDGHWYVEKNGQFFRVDM